MSAAADPGAAIVADDLVKRFGDFVAVRNVSFTVARGEIMGFLGPNGAGKSTVIRILCGLLTPTSGRAMVAGIDVARNPDQVRQNIGYMSQIFSLYGDLSVVENLGFFAGIYGVPRSRRRERIAYAVGVAGLEGSEQRLVSELSGAWRQRLALGCAILHEPAVLFLDEPTSGVDPNARRRFWDLIETLGERGISVLVTTHHLDEAEYCNRIALLAGGRLMALGTPDEIRRRSLPGQLYDIACDDLPSVQAALAQVPQILDVVAFGSSLHVLVPKDMSAADLERAVRVASATLNRIDPIEPSLEDVFVQLIGTRPKSEAA